MRGREAIRGIEALISFQNVSAIGFHPDYLSTPSSTSWLQASKLLYQAESFGPHQDIRPVSANTWRKTSLPKHEMMPTTCRDQTFQDIQVSIERWPSGLRGVSIILEVCSPPGPNTHICTSDFQLTFPQAILYILSLITLVVTQASDEVIKRFLKPAVPQRVSHSHVQSLYDTS